MKKILLGTTALVSAAAAFSAPALASDPLKVTVGGTIVTGFYVVDQDDIGATSFQDTKIPLIARNIDIKAEGTLDNGMVAGALAKLQLGDDFTNPNINSTNNASFRQLYAYLEGGFGRFEIGGTDGAAYKMHYTSPWFVPGNGVDTPNIYNNAVVFGRTSTFSLMATDANKVTYFTPRFAGFQLGASYTPDVQSGFGGGPARNALGVLPKPPAGSSAITDVFELAGNYSGTIGAVDLGVDGFWTTGQTELVDTSPEEYGFGASLGYMGFTLGGAYYESQDLGSPTGGSFAISGASDVKAKTWTAGLSYGTGPWKVGVAYLDGTVDFLGTQVGEVETWQTGGGYNLGSGVDLGLDVQYIQNTPFAGSSIDSTSAGLVLSVAF